MASQHFFVEGRYLGSRLIPNYRKMPGLETRWHHSYVYFCGRCGDLWARFLHDQAEFTQLMNVRCRKHGDGVLQCHETWADLPLRFERDWPLAAKRYEFETLIGLAEEKLKREESYAT